MVEKTSEQVLATTGIDGQLSKLMPKDWAKKVRLMRRDPTLGFVRDLYMAPLLASEWSVVADDPKYEDAVDIVYDAIVPKRLQLMENAIRGLLDFGWQAFEQVFSYTKDGWITLRKLKPLLQDITYILVNSRGDIKGVRNLPTYLSAFNNPFAGPWIDLNVDECLVISRDVEGTNWYGEALMRRVEAPFDSWNECEYAAKRFDTKIAGAHWVVYYPIGRSRYNGQEAVDNFIIANGILDALTSSGKIAIPQKILQQTTDLNSLGEDKTVWKIEMISASGSSESSFVGRQKYLDALKARGLGIPERAVFEGQFGTKAEAEAHADFAIDNIEMAHVRLIEQVNTQVVNQLLRLNKGEHYEDHVTITATPLSDWKRSQLRNLYTAYFGTESGQAQEIEAIDWDAVREVLGIPTHADMDKQYEAPAGRGTVGTFAPTSRRSSGELTGLSRRQMMNVIKDIKDMRREIASGATTKQMAVEVLQSRGISPDRAERFLADVIEPSAGV